VNLTPSQRRLRLQIIFAVMAIYAALLFVIRPHLNNLQIAFAVRWP
jgi:hypothetical protein